MKKIIETYEVGEAIDISKEQSIVDTLKKWESDPKLIQKYKANCGKAALELNWQAEYQRAKNKLLNF